MEIGNIVYLYTIDLLSVIAVKQSLIPERFCKVTCIKPVKGGTEETKYLEYTATSLLGEEVYTFNNYLSPYQYCNLEELETNIESIKPKLLDEKYNDMKQLIDKIKEAIQ